LYHSSAERDLFTPFPRISVLQLSIRGWGNLVNKIILLLSLVPAILWILYFYYQDKYEKEPLKLLLFTFLGGCLSVIPALFIELPLGKIITFHIPFSPTRILISMLMVGFAEEICKFLAVWFIAYRNDEFNEPMDGIVYCVTAALGFAFVENIGYMLKFRAASGLSGAYTIGVMRAIFSMFGHASFGVIMGSYLGRARFDRKNEKILIIKGIVFAALIHLLYNYTLTVNKEIIATFLVLIAFLLMWRNMNRVQMDAAVDSSPFKPPTEKYKPKSWKWGMINIITILLISLVIVLSVVNFNKPITYRNKRMHYLFEHPSFWKRLTNRDQSIIDIIGPRYRDNTPRSRILVRKIKEKVGSRSAADNLLNELKKKNRGLEVISRMEAYLAGSQAHQVKYKWKQKHKKGHDISMLSILIVTSTKGRIIAVINDSMEERFGESEKEFQDIINSVQLMDSR